MKIRVNPLFCAFAIILILSGHILDFVFMLVAIALHELSHIAMARLRGYMLTNAEIMPYGAVMSVDDNLDKLSSILIGLAGPVCSGVLALITLGTWWIAPSVYAYSLPFFYANISLALFNFLPVYPLDGSRVVLGLCKNKLRAMKGLQIAGIVVSVILFSLFIASIFYTINFSLGIMAVFLLWGALFGVKGESYISIVNHQCKNYIVGVERKVVEIARNTPIVRLYHHINNRSKTTFHIVDNEGVTLCTIDESELKDIAIKNKLSLSIGEALKVNKINGKSSLPVCDTSKGNVVKDCHIADTKANVGDKGYRLLKRIAKLAKSKSTT